MTVDVALVGGGLANLLIASRLAELRPEIDFVILEAGAEVGGNHTWSFHGSDLDIASRPWITGLARSSWDGYDVQFPGLTRRLHGSYHSVSSNQLRANCSTRFGNRIRTGVRIAAISPHAVTLPDGASLDARLVIDGRGWDPRAPIVVGYQRFFGLELALERPHGLTRPIIMDATVNQDGGYRFMYTLPFEPTTVLLEDTVYSDTPAHDAADSTAAIERYARDRGWAVRGVTREERGALPIPLVGHFDDVASIWVPGVPTVGVRAGLFHSTTGYSLPYAARVAELVARQPVLTSEALLEPIQSLARQVWRRHRYFRLLNRMLFFAAAPRERYRILERFYGLSPGLITRFYGDRLEPWDRLRLVIGRPPVPIVRGLACLPERVPTRAR